MRKLKKHIHDDSNGLDYVLVGDYYIPDLQLPEESRQSDGGDGCTGIFARVLSRPDK